MDRQEKSLIELNAYLEHGIHAVKGWCVPQLWQTIWPLATHIGPGTVAEIGVFEGKFLLGLLKTFDPLNITKHAAMDVFDMQQFNIDKAGVGKAGPLDENAKTLGIPAENVVKIRRDSLSLRTSDALDLVNRFGYFKFFSVDGCHEVVHTMNDIEFAMEVTDQRGIIAVDDYLNADWPGVSEAVAKMYLMRSFNFIPLAVTCNKLLLCSYSYHNDYLNIIKDYISTSHKETKVKEVVRFGFKTLTIRPNVVKWENLQ